MPRWTEAQMTRGVRKSLVGRNSQGDLHLKLALNTAENDDWSLLYGGEVLGDLE